MTLYHRGGGEPYRFDQPLTEAIIRERPNRFIMSVELPDGSIEKAHCPNTGKIGSIDLAGRPVLLSRHDGSKRKLHWTTEALSYDKPSAKVKEWIGINQNATNRYVEHFLRQGVFDWMVKDGGAVTREQKLGNSRIDFRVGDTYIEVKTPVQVIQKIVPDHITVKGHGTLSGGERLVKHVTELGEAKKTHERVIMLTCFLYEPDVDADETYDNGALYGDADVIMRAFNEALGKGLSPWVAEFRITPTEVSLLRYYRDM